MNLARSSLSLVFHHYLLHSIRSSQIFLIKVVSLSIEKHQRWYMLETEIIRNELGEDTGHKIRYKTGDFEQTNVKDKAFLQYMTQANVIFLKKKTFSIFWNGLVILERKSVFKICIPIMVDILLIVSLWSPIYRRTNKEVKNTQWAWNCNVSFLRYKNHLNDHFMDWIYYSIHSQLWRFVCTYCTS